MAHESVQESTRPINPTKRSCGDPVMDLYAVCSSLKILATAYEAVGKDGDANIIELLRRQISEASQELDNYWGRREGMQ